MVGIEVKIIVDNYKNENGENRYMTKIRANSFRFLDYKNNNINIATVQESEENYYDSKSLFNQVNDMKELGDYELPF